MAAPAQVTISNLSGKFALNKSLSDEVDTMLALQGISWITRKIIGASSIVLTIRAYEKDSTQHIDTTTLVAGLDKTEEERILDWQEYEHIDKIFGKCRQRNRVVKTSELKMDYPGSATDSAFLSAEKLRDGKTDSRFSEEDVLQNFVESIGGATWKCEGIWGFETVNGERRHTRRVIVWNKGKEVRSRLVYDYKGEA